MFHFSLGVATLHLYSFNLSQSISNKVAKYMILKPSPLIGTVFAIKRLLTPF